MSDSRVCLTNTFVPRTVGKSRETKSYKCLSKIVKSIKRHDFNGSFYEYAEFEVYGREYFINYVGSLWKKQPDGSYLALNGRWAKNRVYREFCFDDAFIKSYVLVMTCLTDWFLEKYMSDGNLVINHCVECLYVDERGKHISRPEDSVNSDIRYLEVVTQELNIRHGRFIRKYGLYNTYVSANDIEELEKLFEEANFVDIEGVTKEFYRSKNLY